MSIFSWSPSLAFECQHASLEVGFDFIDVCRPVSEKSCGGKNLVFMCLFENEYFCSSVGLCLNSWYCPFLLSLFVFSSLQ